MKWSFACDGHRLKRQIIDLLRTIDGEYRTIMDWKTSETPSHGTWANQLANCAKLLYKAGMGNVANSMVWSSRLKEVIGIKLDKC